MKIKITYILSDIDKAIAFEWIVQNLNKEKFELSFLLLNEKETLIEKYLINNKIYVKRINLKTKKDFPKVFFKIIKELRKIRPDIVHTHLLNASILGLSAAKLIGVKKRIYTRHHSTFHHENFPRAVLYDKYVNSLATNIIAISKNVRNVLIEQENVNSSKISLIYHGFDLNAFQNVRDTELESIKNKYLIPDKHIIIGIVARYINWKGHKYQIEAYKKVIEKYPNIFFVFANANGPNKKEIQQQLQNNLPKESYIEIEFENNLFALYKLFDIYVHTPINKEIEAFGQTYVEALASGIPSVFTMSGVASEFIIDRENALVVDYCNSEEIFNSIIEIIENKELRTKLITKGKSSIIHFDLKHFIGKLEKLYEV